MKNKLLNALLIALMLFQATAPIGALAYASTDQGVYTPGSVVTLYGDNSDGAGFLPGERVRVDVNGLDGSALSCEATAGEYAAWACQVALPSDAAEGEYAYTATGEISGAAQGGSFTVTAPPAAEPAQDPTQEPTQEPTAEPTSQPTEEPTQAPTQEPTSLPTQEPTAEPTQEPSPTAPAVLSPFITSDKEDYPPGALVTLTSGNWQPGEWVRVFVNDNVGQTWSLTTNVQAAENGSFVYQFNLPDWFVATYRVTATGEVSGIATTDFTDARVVTSATINGGSSVTVAPSTSIAAVVNVTTDGTGANARWRSTGWRISTSAPGSVTCVNHANHDGAGSYSESFNISAPSTTGTFNAYFTAYNDDTCSGGVSNTFTLTNGVLVKSNQTITVTTSAPAAAVYNSTFNVAATATSGLPVAITTSGVCSGSGSGSATITMNSGVGTCTVNFNQAGNATYFAAPQVTQTTTAQKANQSITFEALGNKTYGDADFTVNATASSGLGVSFSSQTLSTCTVSGNTVHLVAAGLCTIRASQAGNTNYNAAPDVDRSFTVQQRAITVTADAQSKTYGDSDPALTYQVTSGSLVSGDSFTGALARVAGENIGTYAIQQGTLALNSNYVLTYVGADLSIAPRPITVEADDRAKIYGDADPALTYSITDGSLAFSDAFTGALVREAGEDVGSYGINQGTLALNSNYALTFDSGTFTIGTRAITVTADAQSKTYGDDDPALTYQVTSGSLVSGDGFTGALTRAAGEDVGAYAIQQGTLALNSNYVLTYIGANLTIDPRPVTVTADDQTKVYGEDDPDLTYEITSGSVVNGDSFTGALTRAAGENVGVYAISQGSLTLGDNYDLTVLGADLTITARPITVTADARTKIYGAGDPVLTYQITNGSLAFSDAFTGFLARAAGEDVGSYAIEQGTLALSSNYDLSYVGAELSITKATLTVTAHNKSKTYGEADPAFTFEYDGFQFSDDAGDLETAPSCSVSVPHNDAGSYTIVCSGGQDNNYDFSYQDGTLSVGQALLTVTADDQEVTYGDADPAFSFQYSGFVGDDDAEDIDTAPACTVSGAHTDAGVYEIVCSGGSDNNYSFTYVDGILTVNRLAVTVTADPQTKVYGEEDPALTYELTSGSLVGGDSFTGALTRDPGEDVGTYAIKQGTLDLNNNYDLTFVDGELSITQAGLTVTADDQTITYGQPDPAFTFDYSGFIGGDDDNDVDTPPTCSVSGAHADAGDYDIVCSGGLDNNYSFSYVNGTLTVEKALLTVTAEDQTVTYGDTPVFTFQYAGFRHSDDAGDLDTAPTCSVAGPHANVGIYTITCSGGEDNNYDFTYVNGTLTVERAALTITADDKSKTYGDANPTLTASYDGFVNGDGPEDLDTPVSLATTADASSPVGGYPITASGASDANYTISFVNGTLTVEARLLTITADDQNKTYGDTFSFTGTEFDAVGLVNGDQVTGVTLTSAGAAASAPVGDYPIVASNATGSGLDNYSLSYVDGTLTVGPKTLTVTADDQNKTYGEEFNFTGTEFTTDGLVNGDSVDSVTLTSTGAPATAAVGLYDIVASNAEGSGLDNYTITYEDGALTVEQKLLTITANDQSKTYGASFTFDGTEFTSEGLVNDDEIDSLTLTSAGAATTAETGSYAIVPSAATGTGLSNYTIDYVNGTFTVDPKGLTVIADNLSKTYGNTLTFTGTEFTTTGLVNSDTVDSVTLTSDGAAATAAAGSYAILASDAIGTGLDNYTITYQDGELTVDARPITITADSKSKVYGELDPALTYSISSGELVNGDTISGGLVRDPGEDVGDYDILQGTLSLSTNYDLTFEPGIFTIELRQIEVTADNKNKTYGDADPALTYEITDGSLAFSDDFTGALARDPGEDVGDYAITKGTLALSSNYTLSFVEGTLSITQKAASVTPDAAGKIYGDADPVLTGTLSGFLPEDGVTASYSRTPGEDVGTYTISATLSPADVLDNYEITYNTADFDIDPRAVQVTADAKTKVYGETDPELTYFISSGSLAFSDAFTGDLERVVGEDVGSYAILQGSLALNSNYELSYVGANLDITQRPVTVTADDKSKTYGDTDPGLTYQITSGSLAFSDAITGELDRDPGENVGSYAIIQGTLALSANYDLTFVPGTLDITVRSIQVTADDKSKTYGDTDPALMYEITGGSLAFTDVFTGALARDPGEDVGTYAITKGTLALSANYNLTFVPGTLEITQKAASVTPDAASKIYGAADPIFTGTLVGFLPADAVTATYSRTAGETVLGGPYTISATLSPVDALSNYDITYNTAEFTIDPKAASVTPDAAGKTYGDADPALTGVLSGFLSEDGVTASYSRASGEDVGAYTITATLDPASVLSNYDITYNTADFTITRRPVEVTADARSKIYGNPDPALTYQITAGSLAFSDAFTGSLTRAAGEDVGMYAITQGTLSLSDNYELSFIGADLSITERPIEVTADASSKIYGNADPALTYQITEGSLAFSDAFIGALERVTGENVGSYAITQGTLTLSDNYDLMFVPGTLEITTRAIEVTADDKNKTYGDADPALTYEITSGTLAFNDALIGALERDPGEDVDTYDILQGTLALSTNYDLTFVPGTLDIITRAVEVTADDKSKTYGDADPALTYEITDGSLAFSDEFTGVLARDLGEDVGEYAITQGTLVLSDNYNLTFVPGTLEITQKAASVTPDAAGKTYGDSDPVLTGTLSGFLLADGVTASYSRTAGEDVGTYTISATLSPVDVLDNYEITYNTADFDIDPRAVEVTAHAKTKVYGEADPELTYFISSGSLAFSDAFTGDLERVVGEDVGMYAIAQGTLSLNDNYELSFVGANLTITERPIEVTADARSKVYGNSDPALTYQITSGSLAFSDAFNGALSRGAGENVGTYAITQGGLALSGNYDLTFVGADFSITERPITVTAYAKSKVYGSADPALTYQITSGTLAFSDVFSGSLSRATGEDVGTYAIIQGTLALSSNYALTYIGANFEITKATLTVTADNKSKLFGDADPAFTFQYGGFVNGEGPSVIDTAPSCGVIVPHAAVGSYPIACSGGLDNNYSFSYVNGVLTVGNWMLKGFYQPVDMSGTSIVYNTVKGGSTVPLKFEIFSGSTELTALSNVKSLTYAQTSCTATATSDEIETVATGGTILRYDSTSGQFVYNWKTPTGAGKCYRVTMTTLDGSTLVAYFKLK